MREIKMHYCNQHSSEIRLHIVRVGLASLVPDDHVQFVEHFEKLVIEQDMTVDNFDPLVQMEGSIAVYCAQEMGIPGPLMFEMLDCPMCCTLTVHRWWCDVAECPEWRKLKQLPAAAADAMLHLYKSLSHV